MITNDSGEVFYLAAYAHYGQIQHKRFRGLKLYANAQMGIKEIKKFCPVGAECQKLLEMAVTRLGLSARAYDRILKVARTIADLAGKEDITPVHCQGSSQL